MKKMKAMSSFKAKVVDPCTKFLSMFKQKFHKPTFRIPRRRRRTRPIRTRVVRFRKPFTLKSLSFPHCGRPKTAKIRLRTRRRSAAAISSKLKRALHFRRKPKPKPPPKRPAPRVRVAEVLTVLFSLRKGAAAKDGGDTYEEIMDSADDDTEGSSDGHVTAVSVSERGHEKEPFPSPITPAFARYSSVSKKESSDELNTAEEEEEEDEEEVEEECRSFEKFMEEEKVKELMDVEEACRRFEKELVEMIVEEGNVKELVDMEEVLYCWKNLKNPVFIELVCRFYGELCKDMFCAHFQEDQSP